MIMQDRKVNTDYGALTGQKEIFSYDVSKWSNLDVFLQFGLQIPLVNRLSDYLRSIDSSLNSTKVFKLDLLIIVKDEDYNETVLSEKWKFEINCNTESISEQKVID